MVATLEAVGVTHVLGIPDNTSGPLFDALGATHHRLVIVTREGEAFAMASGSGWAARRPSWSSRTRASSNPETRCGAPPCAWARPFPSSSPGAGTRRWAPPGSTGPRPAPGTLMVRADVDSVALLTEPTLDAWAVPFEVCATDDDPAAARRALVAAARDEERPVALLLTAPRLTERSPMLTRAQLLDPLPATAPTRWWSRP